MRIYFFKGPVVVFGLLFPLIMFLTFFIGRNLDLVLFFPGFLGMMLFFTASSVGPLITPWEKAGEDLRTAHLPPRHLREHHPRRPAGRCDLRGRHHDDLPLTNAGLLAFSFVLGSITFAALGTLLASPTTNNPSNIMMISSLVRLPLIFVSGIFVPLGQLGWLGMGPHLALLAHVPRRPLPRGAER